MQLVRANRNTRALDENIARSPPILISVSSRRRTRGLEAENTVHEKRQHLPTGKGFAS